ncbi:MAG: porin [Candidatus Competibacteraceae bacterium]
MVLYSAPLWSFDLPENLQFHGFASQGYSLTSENNFFGQSQNDGSFDYTEVGANASWLPFNHLQLSGQLLFRRAGETDPHSLRMDYGFLDYTVLSDETNRWGLRLGRVKIPTGFYNETRDVAFTRPSILLPQSIYPDSIRSLSLSSDGLYVYGERRSEYGDFFLSLGAGYPQAIDRELEPFFFGEKLPGKFESKPSYISRLLYEWNGGQIRAAVTYFRANLDYNSSGAPFPDDVPSGSLRIQPWIFSLQYNAEHWSLTGEYSLRKLNSQGFGQSSNTVLQESYYIQGSYRFSPQWEVLLRYDVDYADIDDKNGKKQAASDPFGRPYYHWFAKDWTVGLSWYALSDFMLRAEYHRVDGTYWLPALDNPDLDDTSHNWGLFLIMASYRF